MLETNENSIIFIFYSGEGHDFNNGLYTMPDGLSTNTHILNDELYTMPAGGSLATFDFYDAIE